MTTIIFIESYSLLCLVRGGLRTWRMYISTGGQELSPFPYKGGNCFLSPYSSGNRLTINRLVSKLHPLHNVRRPREFLHNKRVHHPSYGYV